MDAHLMISLSMLMASISLLLYSLDPHIVVVKVTIDGQDDNTDPEYQDDGVQPFDVQAYVLQHTTPRRWAVAGHYAKALLSRKSPVYKSAL